MGYESLSISSGAKDRLGWVKNQIDEEGDTTWTDTVHELCDEYDAPEARELE